MDKAFNGREALIKIEQNLSMPPCAVHSMNSFGNVHEKDQHKRYQMILLDNNMPIMSGLEAAIEIREW